MAIQNINNTPADSGLGDTLYVAFGKVNAMMVELYNADASFEDSLILINDTLDSLNDGSTFNHQHTIANIIGLQTLLNSKVSTSTYNAQISSINSSIQVINETLSTIIGILNTKVEEAPVDNLTYGRRNSDWVELASASIHTLQEVLDNNHDLVDGIFNAGTEAGDGNTSSNQNAMGSQAGYGNSGDSQNAMGIQAGKDNIGDNQNALGNSAGYDNTGDNVNSFGFRAGYANRGDNVNSLGTDAGHSNTFNNVNLFGKGAQADEDGQTVLSKNDTIMARISTTDLTETRKYTLQDNSGTLAHLDDIPTNTSDLVNDGEDGTSPYVTVDQLPSNLNLFATNVSSDIATYFKLVTSIDDPDYNDTAVDIPTGAITTTGQFIAALATTANVLVGNPGIINLLTIGNVRRTSGSGTADFYYEVYQRTSAGVETLVTTSNNTIPISVNIYTQFLASGLLNNGIFLDTDRIVVKYYANRIGGGSNPSYEFQFGGETPVRTTFPVPASNIPLDAIPTSGSTNGVQSGGVFNALALKGNTTVATTGVDIFFVTPQIYNTSSSPATANITNDLTGANLGVIQKIYHNHSVAPTVPGGWVLIGGEYKISELNIIYAEWCGSSRVEYWITQEV